MFYVLILLKACSILHYKLSHTSIHLSIQHGILILNLNIHLSCFSSHHKPSKPETQHGRIIQTCYCISLLRKRKQSLSMFIIQNKIIFKTMHVHMNACLTSLTSLHHSTYALMHGHIICMFMAKQQNWKIKP